MRSYECLIPQQVSKDPLIFLFKSVLHFVTGSRKRLDFIIFPFTLSHHSRKKKVASSSLLRQPLPSFDICPSVFENFLVLKHRAFQAHL